MTGNLALPQQQSLDRLSPDDGAVGRRVSVRREKNIFRVTMPSLQACNNSSNE